MSIRIFLILFCSIPCSNTTTITITSPFHLPQQHTHQAIYLFFIYESVSILLTFTTFSWCVYKDPSRTAWTGLINSWPLELSLLCFLSWLIFNFKWFLKIFISALFLFSYTPIFLYNIINYLISVGPVRWFLRYNNLLSFSASNIIRGTQEHERELCNVLWGP